MVLYGMASLHEQNGARTVPLEELRSLGDAARNQLAPNGELGNEKQFVLVF